MAMLFIDSQNDSELARFRLCIAREKAAELQKFVKKALASFLSSALEDLVPWMASQDEILNSEKVTEAEIISVLNVPLLSINFATGHLSTLLPQSKTTTSESNYVNSDTILDFIQ